MKNDIIEMTIVPGFDDKIVVYYQSKDFYTLITFSLFLYSQHLHQEISTEEIFSCFDGLLLCCSSFELKTQSFCNYHNWENVSHAVG